jgi:uncharacterized protein (TIRG00374 family)
MKKIILITLKYLLAFGLGALLIWLSLKGISKEDKVVIKDALLRARHLLVLPVFILLLVSHIFRSARWKQMIEPMGYKPPVFDLLCGLLVGYIGNQLIPRAGELLRCTVVARQQKIPLEKLIGTIVAERAIDVLCLIVLSIAMFFIEYDYIKEYLFEVSSKISQGFDNGFHNYYWLIIIALLALTFFLFRYVRKSNNKWKAAIMKIIKGLWEGLISVKKLKHKGRFLVYTFAIWACYLASVYIGCFALQETMHLRFGTSIAMLVFGTVGIIIAPGGLGAYPFAIQKTLFFYGINKNIAIAFGWLLWLAQFLFTIIFGILGYIAINLRNK